MHRQFSTRRPKRSTRLVASAFVAAGAFAAPSALIFADTPSQPNAQTPPADVAATDKTERPADVIVESIQLQEFARPSFNAERPLRISAEEARKFEALVDLYAYAYPLVLSNEIKRETTSRFFLATPNETFYFPRLPDARYRATEFPNVDSIFATAWLDLAREPQIIVAPSHTNAPFSLEIVDAWSNVVASFDEKTLAKLPSLQIDGRSLRGVALVGPNSPRPTNLPPEIRVVESPSSLALVLTRVFVDNSTRAGAFGVRPIVQTLYDFATVSASTFTSKLKDEATNEIHRATAPDDEKPADKAVVKPASDAQEIELNQDLTPAKTSAFDQLKQLYVAQQAKRYAARVEDDKSQVGETASQPDAEVKDEKPSDATDAPTTVSKESESDAKTEVSPPETSNDAASTQNNDKTTHSERADADARTGERNYERERDEERREVESFWRETKEREHEAAQELGATYDDVKRWFYNRFENDRRFWNQFDEALKRDARRDLRQVERFVETPRPTRPWFEGPVERVARMSPEKYWATFVELLKTNPPTNANEKIANDLQTLGIEPGKSVKFDANLRKLSRGAFAIARKKIELAAQSEIWRNATSTNWIVFKNLGDYGDDYLFRASAAGVAFGVNVEKNVLYPFTFLDSNGEPLDGAASYVLRFAPGDEPPTDFLWSLTLYNPDGYLVRNEIGKYGVRSDDALKRNQDGSLEILIQREKPQGDTSNWIPAPRGPFVLAMRVYRPNEKASNGDWTPPAIQKIERETTAK